MDTNKTSPAYTNAQTWGLVLLRLFIGWHFLYEGVVKLWNSGWSAGGYLMDSQGFMAEFFYTLAANPAVLSVVDFLNVWGLILIGLSLILGIFTRVALIGGMVLLGFYYLSHPPLIGVKYALPSEGSYLFINKNLIELAAMYVLFIFPSSHIVGLDRFFRKNRKLTSTNVANTVDQQTTVSA